MAGTIDEGRKEGGREGGTHACLREVTTCWTLKMQCVSMSLAGTAIECPLNPLPAAWFLIASLN